MTAAKQKDKKKDADKPKGQTIFTVGKRKRAVARTVVKQGSGRLLINGFPPENLYNEIMMLRLKEPFMLVGEEWKKYDFIVRVTGGGVNGQIDAVRQSVARALVKLFGNEAKQKILAYDRNMFVYDPRRTEPHKPPRSSQGPRRYKQRSKR